MEGEIQGKQLIAPRPSTRENGERSETTGKRAAGRYEMTTGGNGMGQASTQGTAPATSPDAHGSHDQVERTTSPLSTHHIDITDITKQAARSPPPTRYHIARAREASRSRPQHDIAPPADTRNGAWSEERQSDKKGEAMRVSGQAGEARPHDRRMTGHVITREGMTGAASNTMAARHHRRGGQAEMKGEHDAPAEAPRKRERENTDGR